MTMERGQMNSLPRTLWLTAGLSAMLLSACTSRLPLLMEDARGATSPKSRVACVDVFAVKQGNELERIKATPPDEYFSTIGLPSRPQRVWRYFPDDTASPTALLPEHPLFAYWDKLGADVMVAVCTAPSGTHQTTMQQRMLIFPLDKNAYPSSTRSVILTLSDHGMTLSPSQQKVPEALKNTAAEADQPHFLTN